MQKKKIFEELNHIVERIETGLYPLNIIASEIRELKNKIEKDI